MGVRGTLVLLLLLVGLGLVLWWSESRGEEGGAALTESVLDGRSLLDADRIVVRPDPDAVPIEFERGGEAGAGWHVVEPVRDLASAAVLEALRVAYDGAQRVVAYEPEDVDAALLAETGLDTPRASLRVEWPDGGVVGLAIGLPGPFGHDLFARRVEPGASQRIYRVQTALRNALQLTPADARERLVFRSGIGVVRSIRLVRRGDDGAEDVLGLVRRGTAWVMREPAALRIDQTQTDGFVRAVLGLRIDEFLPGRPQEGLAPIDPSAPPDVRIEIEGGPQSEQVDLYFLEGRAALVGHNHLRALWFTCETRGYEQVVEIPIRTLRAYWLFQGPVDELQTIRLLPSDAPPLELERRTGSEFRLLRPIAYDADPTAVSELLQALRSLAVVEFVADDVQDMAPYGLGEDALVLEVERRRARPDRILVGDDAGPETTWLRRADEPHVVTVPRGVVERLRRPWWIYVDRQLLRIANSERVHKIVRTLPDGGRVEFERGGDGRWRKGGEGDPLPLVADIFDMLRDLRAADVLPAAELGELTPRGAIELVTQLGQVVGRCELAETADGRAACSVQDAPGVRFLLSARDGRDVLGLR